MQYNFCSKYLQLRGAYFAVPSELQYSPPPNSTVLGTGEKNGGIGNYMVIYNQVKIIRGLKISAGIEGEAVNGGAVLGGTTVYPLSAL